VKRIYYFLETNLLFFNFIYINTNHSECSKQGIW